MKPIKERVWTQVSLRVKRQVRHSEIFRHNDEVFWWRNNTLAWNQIRNRIWNRIWEQACLLVFYN